jgi:hypothetical protein
MTPKEKAEELLEKMNVIHYLKGNGLPVSMHRSQIKQCALIAVDEIFFALKYNLDGATSGSVKYWQKVKQEIEKL